MMLAQHLKEAEQIVSSLAWLNAALALGPADTNRGEIELVGEVPSDTRIRQHRQKYSLSAAASQAAYNVMRVEWEQRVAALHRRAAQIGLVL